MKFLKNYMDRGSIVHLNRKDNKILNKFKEVMEGNTLLPPSTIDSKMLTQTNSEKVFHTKIFDSFTD